MIGDDDVTAEHLRVGSGGERPRDDSMPQHLLNWLVGAEFIAIVVFALVLLVRGC